MKEEPDRTMALNGSNLRFISPNVQVPSYDRGGLTQSIVHIGVGGFHRAHQAVYLDDLLHLPGENGWGICGIGLLRADSRMRDALRRQNCLYTVLTCSAAGEQARVIGSLLAYLYAPGGPEAVLEKMASAECRIVSLTVTEGGYYIDQGTGEFDDNHPDIVYDLQHPREPACSFGYLAEALNRRRSRGLPPFTVMSCDNLQQNGEVTRRMFLAFCGLRDPGLQQWLASNCAFPNSMVDRITPVTTDRHRVLLREKFGVDDAWPVIAEPFRQWIIEDSFPSGRPAWERVGARMTSDVMPYEKMKIRLLNASHQAICHFGRLLGYQHVHEAVADAHIRKLVRTLMDVEVTPLIGSVPGINLEDYKNTLLERFDNPAIGDQLARIGMDASARMPKFVLPSIVEQLQRSGPIQMLSLTVAAWFRCLRETDEEGREIPLIDPMAEKLRQHARQGGADPSSLLEIRELFGDALPGSQVFRDQLRQALQSLYHRGTRQTLAGYLDA